MEAPGTAKPDGVALPEGIEPATHHLQVHYKSSTDYKNQLLLALFFNFLGRSLARPCQTGRLQPTLKNAVNFNGLQQCAETARKPS
jgi:hypothetical protein